jgi:hypothetical protein
MSKADVAVGLAFALLVLLAIVWVVLLGSLVDVVENPAPLPPYPSQ